MELKGTIWTLRIVCYYKCFADTATLTNNHFEYEFFRKITARIYMKKER